MLNLALYAELQRLLDDFAAARIEVASYKGPLLALTLYGSVTLREFRDLDFLVRPEDVARAAPVLETHGYRCQSGADLALLGAREIAFGRRRGRGLVELHTALLPRYFASRPDRDPWSRLERVRLGARQVQTLTLEDAIVFLCQHGVQHGWERLAWVADVSEAVCGALPLDWERLRDRAAERGAARALRLGLALAARTLGTAPPVRMSREIAADAALPGLVRQVVGHWETPGPWRAAELLRFHLATRDRISTRAGYLLFRSLELNEHDWSFVALPPGLAPLYYPLRLARLAVQGFERLGARNTSDLADPA
jgi:hypothetical protein